MRHDEDQPASKSAERLKLDHQLCFALYSASLAMTKLYKPLLEPLGLTYPQYLAMLVLWEARRPGRSDLGERLYARFRHPDAAAQAPGGRRPGAAPARPCDERRVLVSLTPAGRALKARAARCRAGVLRRQLQPGRVASLTRRLKQLRDADREFSVRRAA